MAQGRGNAKSNPLLLVLLLGFLSCCSLWKYASATTYTVGDASGWNLGVDYTQWVAGKTFKVGDILFFPYMLSEHDVTVVDKTAYSSCSPSASATTYSAGNTNITLSSTGDHYYLCSVVGHCSGGMKLAVTVGAAAAGAPARSVPAPAPSVTKAPPKATPASAPKSPATPAGAPVRTPVPSVSPPAPSSAPVPVTAPAPSSASASVPVPAPATSVGTPTSSTAPSTGTSSSPPVLSPPPQPSSAPSLPSGMIGLFGLSLLAFARSAL